MIHEPCTSSASSWRRPHRVPANTWARRRPSIDAASASSGRNPTESNATTSATSGCSKSATTTADCDETGPPMNSRSPERLHQRGERRHRHGDPTSLARLYDAHRAFVVVVADQHDRATEVRVGGRAGDQQVSAQRFHGPIISRTTGPRGPTYVRDQPSGRPCSDPGRAAPLVTAGTGPSGDSTSSSFPGSASSIGTHA